jgi:hypothetical protein
MITFTDDDLDEFFCEEEVSIIKRLAIKLEQYKQYNLKREAEFNENEYDICIRE